MVRKEELALWNEELHRARTRVLLYRAGVKNWYIDGDIIHRLEYAAGQGFHDADIYDQPPLSPEWRCIGYARADAVWEFTESVGFGFRRKRENGKLRYRTHSEMQQAFASFCKKKGYHYQQRTRMNNLRLNYKGI